MKNHIKVLRAGINMSQAELAQLCQVSRHAIMAIEKQKHDPSITLACKIAQALGEPIDRVFVLTDLH
ncbi:helix-turn-helix transcriptional regulator [Marinicella meishanensis]|uniref:helix-turn-helix transcriptional regulator n=1 Tax=Marinicella meishanensis TaxID=2873263 RepID=UPI001CC17CF6|nr:helix-turn-helix transcriptional regulator [Marinicella sp. NBU2979]